MYKGPDPTIVTLLGKLRDEHPLAFNERHPPLRVGIHRDIQARHPEIDPQQLAAAMRWWVGDLFYRANIANRRPRVGLDGEVTDPPTEAEAWHARGLLARRKGCPVEDFDPRTSDPDARRMMNILRAALGSKTDDVRLEGEDRQFAAGLIARPRGTAVPDSATLLARLTKRYPRLVLRNEAGKEQAIDLLRCIGPEPSRQPPEGYRPKSAQTPEEVSPIEVEITVPTIRLGVTVRAEAFAAAERVTAMPAVPEVGLVLQSGGLTLTSTVTNKALRRITTAARGSPGGFVVIQGKLAPGDRLEGAGMALQPGKSATEGEVAKQPTSAPAPAPAPVQQPSRAYGPSTLRLPVKPKIAQQG